MTDASTGHEGRRSPNTYFSVPLFFCPVFRSVCGTYALGNPWSFVFWLRPKAALINRDSKENAENTSFGGTRVANRDADAARRAFGKQDSAISAEERVS